MESAQSAKARRRSDVEAVWQAVESQVGYSKRRKSSFHKLQVGASAAGEANGIVVARCLVIEHMPYRLAAAVQDKLIETRHHRPCSLRSVALMALQSCLVECIRCLPTF